MKLTSLLQAIALALGAAFAFGACDNYDNCPAKEQVRPGGSCDGTYYQCPYDLTAPSSACDGTTATIASSCTCVGGIWACPIATPCPDASSGDDGGGEGGGGDDSGTEAGSGDDGGGAG